MTEKVGSVPSASVIVCTHRRPTQLARCLDAIARLRGPSFETIVVENDSTGTGAEAIALAHSARYIHEPTPGLGRARNIGARAATGEVVLYIDDDAEPEPEWVERMLVEFDDPKVVAVAGRIIALTDGSADAETRACEAGFPLGGADRFVIDRGTEHWWARAAFGGIVNGANMAIRRSVFERWPGFDPLLGIGAPIPGGEEGYAFLQLIDRGGRAVYAPQTVVRHPFPQTIDALEARSLHAETTAVAYSLFLMSREPALRSRIAKYFLEGAFGKRRDWRSANTPGPRRRVALWRRWRARLAGIPLYFAAQRPGISHGA